MHVIKAIELKSPTERHGTWKMGSWKPELAKAVTINVSLTSINQNVTLLQSLFVI